MQIISSRKVKIQTTNTAPRMGGGPLQFVWNKNYFIAISPVERNTCFLMFPNKEGGERKCKKTSTESQD